MKNWDFGFLQILIKEFLQSIFFIFLGESGHLCQKSSSFLVKSIKFRVIPESIIVTICPSGSIKCPSSVHQVLPFVHQVCNVFDLEVVLILLLLPLVAFDLIHASMLKEPLFKLNLLLKLIWSSIPSKFI